MPKAFMLRQIEIPLVDPPQAIKEGGSHRKITSTAIATLALMQAQPAPAGRGKRPGSPDW